MNWHRSERFARLLLATVRLSWASSEIDASSTEMEGTIVGMCSAGLSEGTPGPDAAVYAWGNRISPQFCELTRMRNPISGKLVNWTRLAAHLKNWLELPLESWPWAEVASFAYEFTLCGCKCTEPGATCFDFIVSCPVGSWVAALLYCAVTWVAPHGDETEHVSESTCKQIDPLAHLFTNRSSYFSGIKLYDILVSGWPVFTLLRKIEALATLSKSHVFVTSSLAWREALGPLTRAAALVPLASLLGNSGEVALARVRREVDYVEGILCDATGGDTPPGVAFHNLLFEAPDAFAGLVSLEQLVNAHFSVHPDHTLPNAICPALPLWEHQAVSFEEASFVTEFHKIALRELEEYAEDSRVQIERLKNNEMTCLHPLDTFVNSTRCEYLQAHRREAWATYIIANADLEVHLEALRTMVWSVRRVQLCPRPFVVLTLGDLPHQTRADLEEEGMTIYPLDMEALSVDFAPTSTWWKERGVAQTLARLVVFNLTEYDRIVVLEGDMVMTRQCDMLFDIPVFSTGYELGSGPRGEPGLNTGIMVLTPNSRFFQNMITGVLQSKEQLSSHYLVKLFNTDQTILDIFWNSISTRRGAVHLDPQTGCFRGCGHLDAFLGGPTMVPEKGGDRKEFAWKSDLDGDAHCLLPLEFNYYSDFKHIFLLAYRQFVSSGSSSYGGATRNFDADDFWTSVPRRKFFVDSVRWLINSGQLRGRPRILHFPGHARKPWHKWVPRSRSVLDEDWWTVHDAMCEARPASCRYSCSVSSTHTPSADRHEGKSDASLGENASSLIPAPLLNSPQEDPPIYSNIECFTSEVHAEYCCCDSPRGVGGAGCWSGMQFVWEACCPQVLDSLQSMTSSTACLVTRGRITPDGSEAE
eukprot:TRINITY_DN48362_c0_g1_i1.p1 TRINITY_DN48362_c0_g1~~TRINITY_DN48362_c0_g1_i1.p1  ORF type:complete len:869 (+),score=102.54 TRINITY_DN48362_c0_g1_i1:94-2700(+)